MSNDEKLIVEQVHMYPKENARLHHTECFQIVHQEPPQVVLRRGQPFHIVIRFLGRRGFEPTKDEINLIFSFGPNPPRKGIKVVVPVVDKQAPEDLKDWHAKVLGRDANSVNIEVRSPADIAVGQWDLQVETKSKGHTKSDAKVFKYEDLIYFLFNPWVKEDQVYMAEERLLDEYVLNDIGKIWVGPYKYSRGREWAFGQFDEVVLPATMLMLERTHLAPDKRGNPVYLTRAISKLVNSNDDQGVLLGSWSGEYSDGTAPAAWTGSVPILEEFLDTGREVRYGQCWVFAGVVTTVCRALGIPSRVVSNLVSAHDANSSLTIDRYYNAKNEEFDYDPNNFDGEDSIWNYHVWNDVWMLRPDLPKGYGGWQAIDATPQETSDGVYQCGPAPLEAVRCGAVGFNYDVAFLLASVNADVVRWKEDDSEFGFSKIETNQYHVGREILTKKPWIFDPNGERDREDITSQYKNQEGSKTERLTLLNGVRNTERAKRFFNLPTKSREDIEFELVDIEHVNIGEKFSVTVNINNKSEKNMTVQAVLSAASIYYTGVKAHIIKKAAGDFKVNGKSKELLKLTVRPEEYMDKLVEYCNMKIYAIATVLETKETWAEEDDFQVLKPNLDIKMEDEDIYAQKPCTVSFSFKNPLKKRLTNCKFRFEGPGLIKSTAISYRDVSPEELVRVEHRFTPMKHGMYRLIGVFSSKELVDITGSAAFDVLKTEE